ncbi:MAG TPA: HEPN domain-containing protein [Flavisolibacter sp.]|jgi:predicted nucleotidyltransferase|nr:HEPN domain-containing protein [Flavisolibacter sp.]
MKTSLSHLPDYKQQQILQITEIIRDVVAPEKIILFGSYAMGTWVEDEYFENGTRYSYSSDYDFLVVTKNSQEKEHILNDKIVNRSRHLTKVAVNCIIHDIDYVNEGLSFGQYFFADIVKEGVSLYDTEGVTFAHPKELTPEEQKSVAQRYFDQWFERGSDFLKGAEFYLNERSLKLGAFMLHQVTECFYNTVLLVFIGYKPKTHSLEKLRQYAKPYSKELMQIFPEIKEDQPGAPAGDGGTESHLFDLLKRGYIDARYKAEYTITEVELATLLDKVHKMKEIVESICCRKIASFSHGQNETARPESSPPPKKE